MPRLKREDYERGIAALHQREHGAHALVIGNSPWREGFPIAAWFGPTIACNAFYRDADAFPSYIVTFDDEMTRELLAAKVYRDSIHVGRRYITSPPEVPEHERGRWFAAADPAFALQDPAAIGSLAGTLAIVLAGWLGCASITMVGFSLSMANLYAGSPRYTANPQQQEPGSHEQSFARIERALHEFHRLSPGASVHWVAPADWMLAKLDQGAAVR